MIKEIKSQDFKIGKIKRYRIIYIDFNYGDPFIKLKLTYKEWENLITFLNKSLHKKYLPKNKIQYSEFNIHTNEYLYSDSRPIYELFPELLAKYEEIPKGTNKRFRELLNKFNKRRQESQKALKKKEKIRLAKIKKDAQKNLVAPRVYLRKKDVVIAMDRVKFQKFRNCCLNSEKL